MIGGQLYWKPQCSLAEQIESSGAKPRVLSLKSKPLNRCASSLVGREARLSARHVLKESSTTESSISPFPSGVIEYGSPVHQSTCPTSTISMFTVPIVS